MTTYDELPGLGDLYLEDSYLLGIVAGGADLTFVIDAVIVESSAWYEVPAPGEQYCYRKVGIRFPRTTAIEWFACTFRPTFDPDGSIDFDNIDAFVEEVPGRYRLTGAWGDIAVTSDPPVVEQKGVAERWP